MSASHAGAFEAHLTVRPGDPAAFRASCDRLGVGCVLIELPEGEHPAQPMTASVHHGELADVRRAVDALARALSGDGFEVVRTKIEALGDNREIPLTDAAAKARAPDNYFEYHLKLVIAAGIALESIADACRAHDARLSRNARHRRVDASEAEHRFVTLRARTGKQTADARFQALEAAIAGLTGVRIVKRITEYTVYDSALALDRGWL